MRNNFLGGATATGGAGALAITASGGLSLPSLALVADQLVEYSIVQFTDATRATISKSESGWGTISAANVLTRTSPRTTTDGGATYGQNAPAAVAFGASNVFVSISPIAEGGATAFPLRANFAGVYGYGANEWIIGANQLDGGGDYSAALIGANILYLVPLKIEMGFPATVFGVNITAAAAAGKLLSLCIASTNPSNGLPGTVLQALNGLNAASTGLISASVAGRINAPGWYWACFSSDGAPSVLGATSMAPSPIGGMSANNTTRAFRYASRTRAHANFIVGTDVMAGTSGSAGGSLNTPAPILLMR